MGIPKWIFISFIFQVALNNVARSGRTFSDGVEHLEDDSSGPDQDSEEDPGSGRLRRDEGSEKRTAQGGAQIAQMFVKHKTLIEKGTTVFSWPDIHNYTTLTIDATTAVDRKPGIYVGAKNTLLKFDLSMTVAEKFDVSPKSSSGSGAQTIGDLSNFILKVYIQDEDTAQVIICGTNASRPGCSFRLATNPEVEIDHLEGLFSTSPTSGVASFLWNGEAIVGTGRDPEGRKGDILRSSLKNGSTSAFTKVDENWLHDAEFVGDFSISQKDPFVYFVFREISWVTPKPEVISRVARICKDDTGTKEEGYFGSFIKATIACNGYEHVTAISYVEDTSYLWATFTSTRHFGSVICNFELSKLESVFRGPFLVRSSISQQLEACPPPYLFPGDEVVETCFGLRSIKAVHEYTLMHQTISSKCYIVFPDDYDINKISVTYRQITTRSVTIFGSDEKGQVSKLDVDGCHPSTAQVWEVIPQNGTSNKINDVAFFNGFVIVLTDLNVLKIPVMDYPGRLTLHQRVVDSNNGQPMTANTPSTNRTTSRRPSSVKSTDGRKQQRNIHKVPNEASDFSNRERTVLILLFLTILRL